MLSKTSANLLLLAALTATTTPLAALGDRERDLHDEGCLLGQAMLADPARFSEVTGENPSHFPEEREVDIEHIRLEMDFGSLETKSASVVETIVFTSPWEVRSELTLDAVDLDIQGIERLADEALQIAQGPGRAEYPTREGLDFFSSDGKLHISFPTPIGRGERVAIRINYTIHDPRAGLFWIEPLPGDPDPRWEVWSQGQPGSNRNWFACHDYPNDRITSEVIARVPLPNVVSAAGTLVSRQENGDGTVTYHWRIDQDHVSYLTTIVVGQYEVVQGESSGIPLEYYVPPQRAADVARTFSKTPQMMALFEKLFDEPYPYPRYAQLVVRDFGAGGMENVSATTLTTRVLQGESADQHARACNANMEYLIAHELGHTWFGNLITCRNWSHLWLNEGWASYCEYLWAESSCGRDEYDYEIWKNRRSVAAADTIESNQPLVFIRTPSPRDMFGFNGQAAYDKGAQLLHMLRQDLGDEAFHAGVRKYIDLYKGQSVLTDHFRGAMEAASGRDLEWWFRQWCETPGTPKVTVSLEYDMQNHVAAITVEQTGRVDSATPAFRGDMAFVLRTQSGEMVTRTFPVTERRHVFRIPVDRTPVMFAPDPQCAFLMDLTVKAPFEVLRETTVSGPTVSSRCEAIVSLAREGDRAVEPLRGLGADRKLYHGVEREAINALGTISGPGARDALLSIAAELAALPPVETDWRVRQSLAEALGKHTGEEVMKVLVKLSEDPSEPVAGAALGSLVAFPGEEATAALKKGFERRGDHDRLAERAVGAMVRRHDPAALEEAMALTGPGTFYRTRSMAVGWIGELLENDEVPVEGNAATKRLFELLTEPRRPVRIAALGALGKARFKGAIPLLEQFAAKTDDEDVSGAARNAITAINDKKGTRQDVKDLEQKLGALEKRLEKMEKDKPAPAAKSPTKKRRKFLGLF